MAQTERFVAARASRLVDLNARLGELGPAPTEGGNTESPDVTRQRAALEKERNALDAEIRLARLTSVNAQQRRAEVLAQRRAVFEAQLLTRSDSPLRTAFWDQVGAQWQTDQTHLRALAGEFESGLASALHGAAAAKLLVGALGVLAVVAVGLRLAESGLARLVARTVPVGRLRRSLLALLTVLAYVLITGLAFSLAWDWLEEAGHWGTQSTRLAESAVGFGMFLAFVLGLGRSLLANGRSSWRLPPIADDLALELAPLPWLFAFVALVAWLPITLDEVLDAAQRRDHQPRAHPRLCHRLRRWSVPSSPSGPQAPRRSAGTGCRRGTGPHLQTTAAPRAADQRDDGAGGGPAGAGGRRLSGTRRA